MTRRHDDPNISPTAYVVALLIVLFVGTVYALQGYFARVQKEEEAEKIFARTSEELARVRSEQTERISRYEWVDREAGIVTIPVDRAMELVAAELAETGGSLRPR